MSVTLAFVPRRGFTVRPVGQVWQLRNSRHYGADVLHEWPKANRDEAFAQCYRLNGTSVADLLAALGS